MLPKILPGKIFGTLLGICLGCSQLFAEPTPPPRPADVAMNQEAGRGGLLLLPLRLADGEQVAMVMDTGSPLTVLDKSLAHQLGAKLDSGNLNTFDTHQTAVVYLAPKLFLGDVQLQTGSNVLVADLPKLSGYLKPPIKGILGMDCLGHYCVQLDFQAGMVRFLDSEHLDTNNLGRSYPLHFESGQPHGGVPFIRHAGLLGGTVTNTIIDTGNNSDGMTQGRAIRKNAGGSYSGGLIKRTKHFLAVEGWVNHPVGSLKCEWDGNTYTNVAVARGPRDCPNWIGLAFLARHQVTLDFPDAMMYLKQISSGPRAGPAKTDGIAGEKPKPKT